MVRACPIIQPNELASISCCHSAYKPYHRHTLATTHLDAANEDANVIKDNRLKPGKLFGFLVTSGGWRNHNRRQYHNFIPIAAIGPIYLGLKDVSGEAENAQAIHDEFVDLFATLDNEVVLRISLVARTRRQPMCQPKKLETTFPNQL